MDLSLYNKDIQELDKKQSEYLRMLDERAIPILEDMLKAAIETGDSGLIGYVYRTLSFAEFYVSGRYKKFTSYLKKATKYIVENGDGAELTHLYYLMALDALNKGMIDIAHRFFLESRSLAAKVGIDLAVAIMNLNIAQLLMRIEYFEEAGKHIKRCINAIRTSKDHIHHHNNLTTLYMDGVLVSIELDDIDEARRIMAKGERHIATRSKVLPGSILLKYVITKFRLDMLDKDADISADRVGLLCKTIRVTPNIYSYMGDLLRLCRLLIKKRRYAWVKEIIDAIESNRPDDEATRSLKLFAEIKIDYYKAVGDEIGLEAAYKEQDRVLDIDVANRKEIYRYVTDLSKFTGNIRLTRQLALSEQDQLTQIAKIDGLTNIPNRYGATLHLDEAFEKACATGKRLGVVYMDLDGLKFINDTQGHLAGDECLKKTGQLLSRHMEKGEFFAARYGGDEFMLIYEDLSTKEIRDSLAALEKESTVKFSSGIHNAKPKGKEKSWQYIELADKALYEAKKRKK